eukprot:CAMPEP_0185510180 /NCGR_PEP_ID=MMETSP1366-20130426/48637_1 /TAXON_ID=38817 /ORGANISM="Gephyrocapsa oceanica, Strain RCC1303" /LENGTH=74 /DNA_ID=CAMNT_0028120661 /DNA_START=43 /DNA_END=263 /DNA_ORIENTATION=-
MMRAREPKVLLSVATSVLLTRREVVSTSVSWARKVPSDLQRGAQLRGSSGRHSTAALAPHLRHISAASRLHLGP